MKSVTALHRNLAQPAAHNPIDDRYLYVSDLADGVVKILANGSYRDAGAITGLSEPVDVTLDKLGNLYVANYGGSVTQYTPGNTTPAFTYTAGMTHPYGVTADAHGNVFEADAGTGSSSATVNEYFQGVNTPVASCAPGKSTGGNFGVLGVAVDKKGDVFVAYIPPGSSNGAVAEYAGGLAGCNDKAFPFSFNLPEGLALDANGNLLLCDTLNGVVDVLPPPYTSISRTIGSGFTYPATVRLSKDNKRVFIADNGPNTVTVVYYPTGSNLKVLGTPNGISNVGGAVDGPNAVY
jgi:hypothetical protein